MIEINPEEYGIQKTYRLLSGGVAPRPIAFASTIDKDGNPNLAPFSFYNAFGVNPTRLIFSPSNRGRDNTTKHTLQNVKEVPQVVINAVTYDMVQQMSLTSVDFPKGVSEFVKAGLTPVDSVKVKPFRVKESPLQFECKVVDIIEVSGKPGSGNLILCEIVHIHVDEKIMDASGNIDPDKIDLVGRLGSDFYVRTSGCARFKVPKPITTMGIGVDALPQSVRMSTVLSGNDLGQLGNQERIPSKEEIGLFWKENSNNKENELDEISRHQWANNLIEKGEVFDALKVLFRQ